MSSPITLSGFNNIDFSSILSALMQIERQPVTQLETQRSALRGQKTFFAQYASHLAAVESAADALTAAGAFNGRSASLSDATAAAATASASTPVGRYEVRVSELARAQVTTTNSVHADSDSTVVASGGSLVIGGVTVTVAAGTTLEGLASAINGTANIGVTASVVHNSGGYALALTGNQTGASHGFGITNNLTGGSGVSFSSTNAQNASDTLGSVNGVPFSSSSNVVEGALPGGSLTLYKRAPTDPIVVTITGDTNSIKNLIRKFQEAYNGLVDFVADQQKAAGEKNAASIGRDPLVRSVRGELARVLNTERPSGTFTAISQVGLGFSRTGRLEFAESEFDEAIRTDAASVERLFKGSGATLGAFNALQEVLEKYTSAEGLLPTAQDRLDDQLEKIAKRIDEYEARLEIRRAALQKEFTAADLAISQLNASRSQLSSLSSSLSAF